MIGCFTALERGLITDVVYFYDLTDERKAEAAACANKYGFNIWFCEKMFSDDDVELPSELCRSLNSADTIFCPTARDSHNQHALVSKAARHYKGTNNCQLVFYTVDMNSFQVPLPPEMQEAKKDTLLELFKSQHQLFVDEKYFLFEGYSEKDHVTSVSFDKGLFRVVVKGYNPPLEIFDPQSDELDDEYLNRLIVRYYNRMNVSTIAVHCGNNSVEFNG